MALLLVAGTAVAFLPSCRNGFVDADDPDYVADNPYVRPGLTATGISWALTSFQHANWHPLTWWSLQLDSEIYRMKAWGFHLTNVLLHALNAGLLYWVLWRMTGCLGRSALTAALFALHPLRVESVAWVTERKDVLSTLFWLLTMLAYLRWVERPGLVRYLMIVVLFALGLTAKPMLVTLPCVLLLLDYWPLRRTGMDRELPATLVRLVIEKAPLFLLAAASCVVTLAAQSGSGAVVSLESSPFLDRLANVAIAYVRYIGLSLWPTGLAVHYPFDPASLTPVRVAAAALALLLISAWVVERRRRCPYLIVGWLWYLGTLVPVIGLVRVGSQALADRYTYVPQIGLALMCVWGLAELMSGTARQRRLRWGLAATALLACALLSWQQQGAWRDTITLWQQALRVNPNDSLAYNQLAAHWNGVGEFAKAKVHARKALDLRPDFAAARGNLGYALEGENRLAEAIAEFRQGIDLAPADARLHFHLGRALEKEGSLEQALEELLEAVQLNPALAEAQNSLGLLQLRRGQVEEAADSLRQAVALMPQLTVCRLNLASALEKLGDSGAAATQYREVARLDPNWLPTLRLKAWTLATHPNPGVRDSQEALRLARQACLATDHADPHSLNVLAAAYAADGRLEEAISLVRQAQGLARDPREAMILEEQLRSYLAPKKPPNTGAGVPQ